jgi:hypothetical protein
MRGVGLGSTQDTTDAEAICEAVTRPNMRADLLQNPLYVSCMEVSGLSADQVRRDWITDSNNTRFF